jgi:hypothetical protein
MKKFNVSAVAGICLCLAVVSCASSSKNAWESIDIAVEQNNFAGGIAALTLGQEAKKPVYKKDNAVSLYLDKGLIEHYAGEYTASSASLQEAERLIGEAFTKSVSADVASYLANDKTKDYAGEDFEDIYLSVFNALNYYHAGNTDGALVEIRKLTQSSGKLDMLNRKYENAGPNVGEWMMEQLGEIGFTITPELPQGKSVNFANSALARYLGGLLYLAEGNTDGARIEFEQLQAAFTANPAIYSNPLPKSIADSKTAIPNGKARINAIGFTGLSPIKEEGIFSQDFTFLQPVVSSLSPQAKDLVSYKQFWQPMFRLPKFTGRPAIIDRVEVIVGDNKFDLELLEDMGAVIEETYNARFSNLFLKTYIRTLVKYAGAGVAAVKAGEEGAKKSEYAGQLATVSSASAAVSAIYASEGADIRMSRYFPDKAYIGGITVNPGSYPVTVNYYAGGSLVSSETKPNLEVKAGSLNLIEGFCLK